MSFRGGHPPPAPTLPPPKSVLSLHRIIRPPGRHLSLSQNTDTPVPFPHLSLSVIPPSSHPSPLPCLTYSCQRRSLASAKISSNTVLRRIVPLAGASMLKTLLLINELTCLLGNAILLVVLCFLSVVFPRSMCAFDSIGGNGLCVHSPMCACARTYFARYLTVTVKMRTLESIFPIFLAGSLVWWDPP